MRIRLRGPAGASTIVLDSGATTRDLRGLITEKTGLAHFDVKYGYPPKPLHLGSGSLFLSELGIDLNGEQLTVSALDGPDVKERPSKDASERSTPVKAAASPSPARTGDPFFPSDKISLAGIRGEGTASKDHARHTGTKPDPIALSRKTRELEVPELPMPDRGATMVLRVMPDDNSCLFRAFGTAVLPGDDLTMTELRSLVASAIQADRETYTKVVLEQEPDQYCRWIQTEDAWGGAIELTILSQHFDIEICSIDVQSLRIDRFNEGRPTRCILVYSGIHYDTIVQSPSDPPHTKAEYPPDFDRRVWDADDEDILQKALELCKVLQAQHYFTDTGGMGIKCTICGWIGHGEGQAQTHAQQTGHYDMTEVGT